MLITSKVDLVGATTVVVTRSVVDTTGTAMVSGDDESVCAAPHDQQKLAFSFSISPQRRQFITVS